MNPTNWTLKSCVSVIALFTFLVFIGCQTLQQTEAGKRVYEQKNKPDNKNGIVEEDALITLDDLKRARNLWLEKKIANYDITARYEPHGTPSAEPVLIKVRNSEAVSTTPLLEDDKRGLTHYLIFETVEKTFDRIQKELDEQAKVRGAFNPELGYTERLSVDFTKSRGYYRLSIDKFEIVDKD